MSSAAPDAVPASPAVQDAAAFPAIEGSRPRMAAPARTDRRLSTALLVSLLLHALLLSLQFGDGQGLPGLNFPWQERRGEALRIEIAASPSSVVEPAPPATLAAPVPPKSVTEPPVLAAALEPQAEAAQLLAPLVSEVRRSAEAIVAAIPAPTAPPILPLPALAAPERPVPVPSPAPALIAIEQPGEPTVRMPSAASAPQDVTLPAPSASSPDQSQRLAQAAAEATLERARQELQEKAALARRRQLEATRVEAERQEAARQQAAQAEVARLEAQALALALAKQLAAQQEASKREAARLDAERQELARQAAAQQEQARQDSLRQEAARVEAARLEIERKELARQAAAGQELVRLEAARAEAARLKAAQAAQAEADEARREASRRAMGRILDEEAAQRDAAEKAARQQPDARPGSWSTARRMRLFGRSDPNAELILYAEAWARKIQLNTPPDTVRELAKQPHLAPLVTVAIRRDGSIESVSFVVSSGSAAIDDSIRRIVQSQLPYPAFTPGLASQYDVIEIRRTWVFNTSITLQ